MIDLYYFPTPNCHKITIFLEEANLPYRIIPIHLGRGEQFDPKYIAIAPNGRVPAIVDHDPIDSNGPLQIFESGAILQYLGEKTNAFLPVTVRDRVEVMQWLFWQMSGLGPMAGQSYHLIQHETERNLYAIERYTKETQRLYGVLDGLLAERDYIGGDRYSIADMAVYPWIVPYEKQGQSLNQFPHLTRWLDKLALRPAIIRAYAPPEASPVATPHATEKPEQSQ